MCRMLPPSDAVRVRDREDNRCDCNQCKPDHWQWEHSGLTPGQTLLLVAVVLFVIFLAALSL